MESVRLSKDKREKNINYVPDYLSGLSRALLCFFPTTFLEIALYKKSYIRTVFSFAFNWMTETVVCHHPTRLAMLFSGGACNSNFLYISY